MRLYQGERESGREGEREGERERGKGEKRKEGGRKREKEIGREGGGQGEREREEEEGGRHRSSKRQKETEIANKAIARPALAHEGLILLILQREREGGVGSSAKQLNDTVASVKTASRFNGSCVKLDPD